MILRQYAYVHIEMFKSSDICALKITYNCVWNFFLFHFVCVCVCTYVVWVLHSNMYNVRVISVTSWRLLFSFGHVGIITHSYQTGRKHHSVFISDTIFRAALSKSISLQPGSLCIRHFLFKSMIHSSWFRPLFCLSTFFSTCIYYEDYLSRFFFYLVS